MPTTTELACRCGKVHLTLEAEPLLAAECLCESCRTASSKLAAQGVPQLTTAAGGTPFVLYRKDRVRFTAGAEQMVAYRLTATSPTQRVVAGCCNTPLFLEFKDGHWLSLYAALWPESARPAMVMRTMAGDVPAGVVPPGDIPNHKSQSFGFFMKLMAAWIAMGFKVPKVAVAEERVF